MSTLLLADDDSGVRTTLARSLAGYGFAVIATANGQEAISVLRSRDVDLLVTELSLPGTDGFALLAYVKQHAINLPTVVLTAADPASYRERLSDLGSPQVLRKPVSVKRLAHEARGALSEAVRGSVTGITLPSLLQMLEWEHKTCSVRATAPEGEGRLDFLSGGLINAYSYTSQAEGEAAALEIFGWNDADLGLERLYPTAKRLGRLIHTPLQHLLIEAMRQKDERARQPSVDTPEDAVLVGETEDEMFFRRRGRRDAPATHVATPPNSTEALAEVPPAQAAPATSSPEPASAAAVAEPVVGATEARKGAQEGAFTARTTEMLNSLLSEVDGGLAAMLVDYRGGVALGQVGGGVNLEVAAVGNSQVVRAKMKTMATLGLDEELEDILITLSTQYHLLRVLPGQATFVYLVLNRKANLARSRRKLKEFTDLLSTL